MPSVYYVRQARPRDVLATTNVTIACQIMSVSSTLSYMDEEEFRAKLLLARFHHVTTPSCEDMFVVCVWGNMKARYQGERLDEDVIGYMIVRKPWQNGNEDETPSGLRRDSLEELVEYCTELQLEFEKYFTHDLWRKSLLALRTPQSVLTRGTQILQRKVRVHFPEALNNTTAVIAEIVILPRFQSCTLGSQFLSSWLETVDESHGGAFVTATESTKAFFEKFGFVSQGKSTFESEGPERVLYHMRRPPPGVKQEEDDSPGINQES
ncbi:hypothetical protein BKA61DRAFT_578560 [Leptodontidium sp. MPI-SDFR-AT-0119]|nr:hypothetical protein BKA61DRAFT_578560 [Leptodontidium sp. MPI-SDFR-AT-0119]